MPSNRLKKSLTTTIVVPAILMALAAIALLWVLDRQMDETDWVEHTDRVMLEAETAKAEFLSAQTAFRGFLLYSEPNDRAPIQKHWNNSQEIIKATWRARFRQSEPGTAGVNPRRPAESVARSRQWRGSELCRFRETRACPASGRDRDQSPGSVRCDFCGRTGVAASQRRTAGFSIQHRDVGYPHRRTDSRGGADVGGVAGNPERERYIRRRVEGCRGSEPGEDQFPRRRLA